MCPVFLPGNASHRSKSSASLLAVGKMSASFLACETVQLSIIVGANGESTASISSCEGFPVSSMILSSWFMVLVPGKIGFPSSSSPRMQPAQHDMHNSVSYFKLSGPFLNFRKRMLRKPRKTTAIGRNSPNGPNQSIDCPTWSTQKRSVAKSTENPVSNA